MANAFPMVAHCRRHQRELSKTALCPTCRAPAQQNEDNGEWDHCPLGHFFAAPYWEHDENDVCPHCTGGV